jgi:hypothetical protein
MGWRIPIRIAGPVKYMVRYKDVVNIFRFRLCRDCLAVIGGQKKPDWFLVLGKRHAYGIITLARKQISEI